MIYHGLYSKENKSEITDFGNISEGSEKVTEGGC